MAPRCVVCDKSVRKNQHALSCDGCESWTHRRCGTDMTADRYRELCNSEEAFEFNCIHCSEPHSVSNIIAQADMTFQVELSSTMDVDEAVFEDVAPDLSTIDVTAMTVSDEECVGERSISDEDMEEPVEDPGDVDDFTVIDNGSQKGKKKLTDKHGYSYAVRKSSVTKVYWRCSVRNKNKTCPASVIQTGDTFQPGIHSHDHPPVAGQLTAIRVRVEVKAKARENVHRSGSDIVESAQAKFVNPDQPGGRQKPSTLVRMANRTRELLRPKEPRDLTFEVKDEFLPPDFLRGDVINKGERHLIFATNHQPSILSKSRNWYMDGTFKIVKQPFYQLLSIHAFIKSDSNMKMVPLVFVLMSRRRTSDYVKVFRQLQNIMPAEPEVATVLLDFEMAAWKAMEKIFPQVRRRGCLFHHTQAVFRKGQEIGLSVSYRKNLNTHRFMKKLMALPFLPAGDIPRMFSKIESQVPEGGKLDELITYYRRQWIDHPIFIPRSWSVFRQTIRTNNHVEGWHNRMGNKARNPQPFYRLARMLHEESMMLPIQARMVQEGALRSHIRNGVARQQADIFQAWTEFRDGDISLSQLLSRCAMLHGPVSNV